MVASLELSVQTEEKYEKSGRYSRYEGKRTKRAYLECKAEVLLTQPFL